MTDKSTYSLKQIHLLTQDQYNTIETPDTNALYALEGIFPVSYDVGSGCGYILWSNGMIEQWGIKADSETAVVFPYEMTTTTYAITLTPAVSTTTVPYATGFATTGFTTVSDEIRWYVKGF